MILYHQELVTRIPVDLQTYQQKVNDERVWTESDWIHLRHVKMVQVVLKLPNKYLMEKSALQ